MMEMMFSTYIIDKLGLEGAVGNVVPWTEKNYKKIEKWRKEEREWLAPL